MSVVCAEARGTGTLRSTVTTGAVVRRARVRRRDAHIDQFCCSSRFFACSASFARTCRLSDSSEAAARTEVSAKAREAVRGTKQGGRSRDAVAERMAPVRRRLGRCQKYPQIIQNLFHVKHVQYAA